MTSPHEPRARRGGELKPGKPSLIAVGFFPGLLAGTQLAGLLFFLNPHIPFDPPTVAAGVGFYGGIFGIAGFAILIIAARGRLHRIWRWLPAILTVILLFAAAAFWTHAYAYGFYLPPGINKRLLKAAIALSVAALACFYTMLLHRLRRRPYGPRSRLLFTAMALLSIYVVVERREAFRPRLEPTPRTSTFVLDTRPFLCVVGLETATLDAILPLAEQGRLPFFSRLLRDGVQARVDHLDPIRRSPAWTTLATGRYPHRHGIVGDTAYPVPFLAPGRGRLRLLPIGLDVSPRALWGEGEAMSRRDLEVPPIWRIMARLGLQTAVVGWPVTDPPEEGVGPIISNRFFIGGAKSSHIQPTALAERARLFRTPIDEIDPDVSSRFGDPPPARVLRALRQDLWREDLAFFLTDPSNDNDALFMTLPGLRTLSKDHFGGFSAVQFGGSDDPESVASSRLVSAYYEHLDEFLANLWEQMREPRLLAIVSAHGMREPGGLREVQRMLLRRPATRGDIGGDGTLLLLGEGIRAGARVRAELVDPVPTLLYGLGFPVARDLDGAVLTDIFDTTFLARQPLTFVPSYEAFTPAADGETSP